MRAPCSRLEICYFISSPREYYPYLNAIDRSSIRDMAKDQHNERTFKKSSGLNTSESSKLYRIALEEGQRSLAVQLEELNGIRSKAVSFVALICTATAFLVSTTVKSLEPNAGFFLFAFIATISMVWALIQTWHLLIPSTEFSFKLNPISLVNEFIECQATPPSESDLLRSLIENYSERIYLNQTNLIRIRKFYNRIIAFGLLSLFIWTLTMWIFGTVGS